MLVYIAAPLFNNMEKNFNQYIDELVVNQGFKTFLPQRDGGSLSELIRQGGNANELSDYIFKLDVEAVKNCDIMLFLLDGRVPDEGACFELGMAYALGKECVGFKTDIRSFADGFDNLMLRKSLSALFTNEDALVDFFKKRFKERNTFIV